MQNEGALSRPNNDEFGMTRFGQIDDYFDNVFKDIDDFMGRDGFGGGFGGLSRRDRGGLFAPFS